MVNQPSKKIFLHLIVNTFPPTAGGLEKRIARLSSQFLSRGFGASIHLCNNEIDYTKYLPHVPDGVTLMMTGPSKNFLIEPVLKGNFTEKMRAAEKWRLDTIIVQKNVQQIINKYSDYTHILISNYATTCGFLAMNVAQNLNLLHICSLVGTDFSKGRYSPDDRHIIDMVILQADAIVCLNNNFSRFIANNHPKKLTKVIHSSVAADIKCRHNSSKPNSPILIFSDCGYCHKKSTHLLLLAIDKLKEQRISVRLVICGKTNEKEKTYWQQVRENYSNRNGDSISFLDYLPIEKVSDFLAESDLYCYPTLGEGCSTSRITALCAGIPIISVACGEITDVAQSVSHVRLSPLGDPD